MVDVLRIALALVFREGRVLISQRRADQHLASLWEFPGGKIEAGESAEQAAVREAWEEVAIRCRAQARYETIDHQYAQRRVLLIPVVCAWISGEPEARQVQAARFVAPHSLNEYAFPAANRELIRRLALGTAPS